MKKQLLSEVKHFQKIAGLLKESFDRDAPESNTYEDVRDWLDNLYPDASQYPDFLTDFKKELQFLTPEERNEWITKFKRDFGEDLNENWHPDDPASVDVDDIEDKDPDDYDDVSEDTDTRGRTSYDLVKGPNEDPLVKRILVNLHNKYGKEGYHYDPYMKRLIVYGEANEDEAIVDMLSALFDQPEYQDLSEERGYRADKDPEVLYKVKDLVKSMVNRFGKSSITIGSPEWNKLVSSLEALFERLRVNIDSSEFFGDTLLDILQDLQVDINHGDNISEDDDYNESSDSESGNTDAMGGINEEGEGGYEKQLTAANQAVANGSQIANSDMYGKITPDKFIKYFKGEGKGKKFIYYYIEPGEEVGAVPVTIEQAAGLIKSLISNVPVPKGLPAGYAWRLYAI